MLICCHFDSQICSNYTLDIKLAFCLYLRLYVKMERLMRNNSFYVLQCITRERKTIQLHSVCFGLVILCTILHVAGEGKGQRGVSLAEFKENV